MHAIMDLASERETRLLWESRAARRRAEELELTSDERRELCAHRIARAKLIGARYLHAYRVFISRTILSGTDAHAVCAITLDPLPVSGWIQRYMQGYLAQVGA